jgi:uncharacterized DUF497 family protein
MQFEWHETKNRANQKKHGVSFKMAALIFEDENCLVGLDSIDETGEQRWYAIGEARLGGEAGGVVRGACLQGGNRWRGNHTHHLGPQG